MRYYLLAVRGKNISILKFLEKKLLNCGYYIYIKIQYGSILKNAGFEYSSVVLVLFYLAAGYILVEIFMLSYMIYSVMS